MQTWPQWRTHWHVLHAWPPGAQALVLVFVSLCLVVAGSWHVSSEAWQTWWEQDAQVLQWEEELQALQNSSDTNARLESTTERHAASLRYGGGGLAILARSNAAE